MSLTTYRVPYSTILEFSLPPDMRAEIALSKTMPPLEDVHAAIRAALDQPIGCALLRELARPGDRACIVFTDNSAPS